MEVGMDYGIRKLAEGQIQAILNGLDWIPLGVSGGCDKDGNITFLNGKEEGDDEDEVSLLPDDYPGKNGKTKYSYLPCGKWDEEV